MKKNSEGLNERQYNDLYREDDVPISNVRKGALRIIFYACFGTFTVVVIAAFALNIPHEVAVPFQLKSDTREINYRFNDNSRVEKVFVKPGQRVTKGTALARVTSVSIVSLLNTYSLALENKKIFESSEVPINRNQKESLTLQRSKYESQINDARKERSLKVKKQNSEIENLQQELSAATKHVSETKKLFSQGFASDKEVREAELKESNAKDALNRTRQQYGIELSSLDYRVKELGIDQSMIGVNSSRSDLELGNRRAQLEASVKTALDKIRDLYGNVEVLSSSIVLKSSGDYTVSYTYDEERELAAGAVLIKLISGSSKMFAAASVQPQNIGTLKVGMKAALKLTTFPHYHWGVVEGTVSSLSITPDDKGNYPFEIMITNAGQLATLLQIGMTGEADLLVDDRPLASYVFDNVAGRFR